MHRKRYWSLFLTLVLGVLLEPVGHACAYLLRYGPSQAWVVQSQAGHATFPRILSLSSISLTVVLALGLMTAISVRLILGRRPIQRIGLLESFVLLALTQCGFFFLKETLEALAMQSHPDLLVIGVLAVMVQLPLAALAALLISWLRGYLELAPDAVRWVLAAGVGLRPEIRLLRPLAAPALAVDLRDQRWYRRRGPPVSR